MTQIGLGGAPLGNLFAAITDDEASATVDAAWDAGIRLFDTAPLYGQGLSEVRLGKALRHRPRDEFVLSTKVGRLLRNAPELEPVYAYSRTDTLRSLEESMERLGVDRLDTVYVHDPDDHEDEALRGAFPALLRLRDQGVIRSVGCGMNQSEMLARFVERVDLDCILIAGRYTLLDRSAGERLLPRCRQRGVEVVIGGVFNSGLLADPDGSPTYDYALAPAELVSRARVLQATCRQFGVSLSAAAIQFALRDPAVTAVLIGARSAAEITADVEAAHASIPEELWAALDA